VTTIWLATKIVTELFSSKNVVAKSVVIYSIWKQYF